MQLIKQKDFILLLVLDSNDSEEFISFTLIVDCFFI